MKNYVIRAAYPLKRILLSHFMFHTSRFMENLF